jgi:chorismate mutase
LNTPDGSGGTVMRDVIDFTAPLGSLGALVDRLVLRRYMIRLIQRRNQYVKTVAESAQRGNQRVDVDQLAALEAECSRTGCACPD